MTLTQSLPIVDAVRRKLEMDQPSRPQAPVRTALTVTTTLGQAPAQLWPMLTRRDRLAQWCGPVSGDLREGGRLQLPGGVGCRIFEVDAPHKMKLAITPRPGSEPEPLTIRLDPEDDGSTSLRLAHTAMIGAQTMMGHGPGLVAIGWELALLRLAAATDGWRAVCLRDVPVPTAQWLAGQEGGEHVRAWAVRWAAQAIAAGVDEQTARRGERETVDSYRFGSDGPAACLRR